MSILFMSKAGRRIAIASFLAMSVSGSANASPSAPTKLCFVPGDDCTQLVVDFIASARQQVLTQAYSFTSAPIAQALAAAKQHGIDVRVILDKSQISERYSGADYLAHAGIPVLIDRKHAIAHNKIIVVDGAAVETGSFNYTKSAQSSNAENAIILYDSGIAAQYAKNWRTHARHSEPYRSK